jgi:hypothetical protein
MRGRATAPRGRRGTAQTDICRIAVDRIGRQQACKQHVARSQACAGCAGVIDGVNQVIAWERDGAGVQVFDARSKHDSSAHDSTAAREARPRFHSADDRKYAKRSARANSRSRSRSGEHEPQTAAPCESTQVAQDVRPLGAAAALSQHTPARAQACSKTDRALSRSCSKRASASLRPPSRPMRDARVAPPCSAPSGGCRERALPGCRMSERGPTGTSTVSTALLTAAMGCWQAIAAPGPDAGWFRLPAKGRRGDTPYAAVRGPAGRGTGPPAGV